MLQFQFLFQSSLGAMDYATVWIYEYHYLTMCGDEIAAWFERIAY